MANKNDQLIVGLFDTDKAAKKAGEDIYEWQVWEDDISLGAMAVLTVDPENGEMHTDEIGERSTKSGLGWGTAVGAVAGLLTGGLGLIPGMVIGGAAGAGLGALNHKSVGMTDEQHAKLFEALNRGGAALAIMCDDFEVQAVISKLKEAGGDVSHYEVQEQVTEAIAFAAAAQVIAGNAVDESADEVDEENLSKAAKEIDAQALDIEPENVKRVSRLAAVTGMSAADAAKICDAGVLKVSQFLALASTPLGRKALAEQTGVDPAVILESAGKIDLMRVDGIGYKEASLLLATGVDSVPDLGQRNPGDLTEKMAYVNKKERIVDEVPSKAVVAGWAAQTKEMPTMLYF